MYQDPLLGLEGLDAVVDKDRVSSILATPARRPRC